MTADAGPTLPIALLVFALGAAGCANPAIAREIDRVCNAPLVEGLGCNVVGVGTWTTGPTADSAGFHFDDGSLVVHLAAVPEALAGGRFDVLVLIVARQPLSTVDAAVTWGSCKGGCPEAPALASKSRPNDDYAWITVASGLRGAAPSAHVPYDAVFTITAVEADLLDLRFIPAP